MVSTHESLLHALMLDSISDGFIAVDEWGRITFLNRAAERLTLWQRGEVAGKVCEEVLGFIADDDACLLEETCQSVRGTEQQPVCLRDRNGRRLAVTVTTTILRWPDGRLAGSLATVRPLTKVQPAADPASANGALADIIGRSPAMENLFHLVPQFAHSSSTILIDGASGTGKELFARAIHNLSPRRDRSFVAVNCGALPDTLLESELFGYKAGAFTDARQDKPGRFALADGGTIFLDEIAEIPLDIQAVLLRVIEDKCVLRIGSNQIRTVDVRIVCATNKNLIEEVNRGSFRRDLYYRLNVFNIHLPPLRERKDDIPLLAEAFVKKCACALGKTIAGVDDKVLEFFVHYSWPGNVRELQNVVERMVNYAASDRLTFDLVPREIAGIDRSKSTSFDLVAPDETEKNLIGRMLALKFSKVQIARKLNISRATLFRKLKKHGLAGKPSGD